MVFANDLEDVALALLRIKGLRVNGYLGCDGSDPQVVISMVLRALVVETYSPLGELSSARSHLLFPTIGVERMTRLRSFRDLDVHALSRYRFR